MGVLYTKIKIFHFREKLESLPRQDNRILAPLHIRLKPTNLCNHNCWYCAYRVKKLQLGKDMAIKDFIPREKIMEIIDDLAAMKVKAVTFSGGGEPFCYPYFKELLRKISLTQIHFASLTNGTLLKGEAAQVFAHHGTWIRISLDGWDDASYSRYRGVRKGEFTALLKNIRDFIRLKGKCYLGICINVDQENARHIFDLTKRLKGLGVYSVKIAPCLISNASSQNNKYHKKIEPIVRKQIQQCREKLMDKGFELFDSYHGQLDSFKKSYKWCPTLQVVPVIGADLNVYSCQDKAYNLKNGFLFSIKKRSFKEAWFSDKKNFFKIDPSSNCNHHCVHHGLNNNILDYLYADKEHLSFV